MKRIILFWITFIIVSLAICAIGVYYPSVFNFGTGVGLYYLVSEFYPMHLNKSNGSSWESSNRK